VVAEAHRVEPKTLNHVTLSRRFLRHVRRVWDVLRWRGPVPFFCLTMREAFRPLFYWYAYYIIRNEIFPPSAVGRPATSELDIVVRHGEEGLERTKVELIGMDDLTAEEIDARFGRGDAVAVAYAGDRAVGYAWMSFNSGQKLTFDIAWAVHPGEAVLHDTFVVPAWRGRRIPTRLDTALNDFAHQHGITYAYSSIAILNKQALRILTLRGKTRILTLFLLRVRGINRTWRVVRGDSTFDAHFQKLEPSTHTTGERAK